MSKAKQMYTLVSLLIDAVSGIIQSFNTFAPAWVFLS